MKNDTTSYNIGERLKAAMTYRKITIAKLAEITGLSEDTIKSIRCGKTKNPSIHVIITIADALNMTLDSFLNRTSIAIEEKELIQDYRKLSKHGKAVIHMALNAELHLQTESTKETRHLACILPTQTKSSDVDYSMCSREYVSIPFDQFPEADIAVRIISNTLYPVFHKGDLLAVEKKFPSIGTIGIFLDGQGTELIRKYTEKDGNMYLESISNCHKSLYYTDDIICLGTVLGIIREAEKYEPDTL